MTLASCRFSFRGRDHFGSPKLLEDKFWELGELREYLLKKTHQLGNEEKALTLQQRLPMTVSPYRAAGALASTWHRFPL